MILIWITCGILGLLYFIKTSKHHFDNISKMNIGDLTVGLIIICFGMVTLLWALICFKMKNYN